MGGSLIGGMEMCVVILVLTSLVSSAPTNLDGSLSSHIEKGEMGKINPEEAREILAKPGSEVGDSNEFSDNEQDEITAGTGSDSEDVIEAFNFDGTFLVY